MFSAIVASSCRHNRISNVIIRNNSKKINNGSAVELFLRKRMMASSSSSSSTLMIDKTNGITSYSSNSNCYSSLRTQQTFSSLPSSFIITKVDNFNNNFNSNFRSYISRAHPKPIPEYEILDAIDMILADIEERRKRKWDRWNFHEETRKKKGILEDQPKLQDETIELVLNLNLDPKLPGQALRGSMILPHGSGKKVNVVVFTKNKELAEKAKETGALHAGGDELIDQIKQGLIPLDTFSRSIATKDIMNDLGGLARMLGPRGLYPNKKDGTVIEQTPTKEEMENQLLGLLEEQIKGSSIPYRTEKFGNVNMGIGKESFGKEKILENIRTAITEIYDAKPETIGKKKKGQKSGKGPKTKYLLKATLSSTQGKGVRLDLRTIEPTSNYFMTRVPKD